MNTAFREHGLPDGASLIATPGVWVEGAALQQLAAVAVHDDCVAAVGMPDLHAGPGIPIGAAFAFRKTVRPLLVGGDIGCGASLTITTHTKVNSALERRVRAEFDGPPILQGEEAAKLGREVWRSGVRGLRALNSNALDDLVSMLTDEEVQDPATNSDLAELCGSSLGTIGGGNHFAEISRVKEVCHPLAAELGLKKGAIVVVCHSGSRGLGKLIGDRWQNQILSEPTAYLDELNGAIRFAKANRALLAWRMLKALGAARPGKVTGAIDVVHNTVTSEPVLGQPAWVHRKGCAPAFEGQPTIVLGTRGTESWVLLGNGSASSLRSVAHGAGRKMSRTEARDKLKAKYPRKSLTQSCCGSRIICDDPKLLYEEHPDAYKPIESVVHSLEQAGAAQRLASLEPMITVKK